MERNKKIFIFLLKNLLNMKIINNKINININIICKNLCKKFLLRKINFNKD